MAALLDAAALASISSAKARPSTPSAKDPEDLLVRVPSCEDGDPAVPDGRFRYSSWSSTTVATLPILELSGTLHTPWTISFG